MASDKLTGWSSGYYELPKGATELQDLIEHKEMNFAIGNIFKACYRLGEKPGADATYDLEKIIWFAQRELERHRRVLNGPPFTNLEPSVFMKLVRRNEGWPAPRCSKCQTQPCSCSIKPKEYFSERKR